MSKLRWRIVWLVFLTAGLAACGEGQQPREFIPAPTTQPPGSLDPRFSNWQVSNGSYGGIEPARVNFF
ncbi:MAG: hypothetical protein AAGG69_16270, partial [Pseudomonadota bacterium]